MYLAGAVTRTVLGSVWTPPSPTPLGGWVSDDSSTYGGDDDNYDAQLLLMVVM